MIDRSRPLPITRQAEALGMARSTFYALPTPISDRDLDLMKRVDRLHLEMPYAGPRMRSMVILAINRTPPIIKGLNRRGDKLSAPYIGFGNENNISFIYFLDWLPDNGVPAYFCDSLVGRSTGCWYHTSVFPRLAHRGYD
jgi:hypothetical protein